MNTQMMMAAEQYDRIDGAHAYRSALKRMTLGVPQLEANADARVAAQIWREGADGQLELFTELQVHQVLDLMIFLGSAMQHCREAYRLPLLYDPEHPVVDRIGLQGDAMHVAVCTGNPELSEDMRILVQALGEMGEVTGERLRVLAHILEELEYC